MLHACKHKPGTKTSEEQPLFELLQAEHTGLDFTNTLTSTKDFNVFHYMYFYNGGGVAVADFNQDGLTDIFFTANMDSNGLYLNQGDMRFVNASAESGIQGPKGWTTGACAVDANQDGMMDIYVSRLGDFRGIKGTNQLFICQGYDDNGIPHFKDEAALYGLDLVGFGTQAAFFDYDRDGDLDMYQLNHSVHNNGTFGQRKTFLDTVHPLSGDRLLRNDNGKYVDVTAGSGIHSMVIGYGLGIATGDVNIDGWPDIYICNDFHENDYLYINQQDGTFKEVLTEQLRHTSRFSMGVDIADINNDCYPEIFTLDMHPYDRQILKSSLGEEGFGTFQFKLGYGYNYQYAKNCLQLNNRDNSYSEIAALAGVYNTDWSWAALFFDFDHDGFKDLFVSNGIPKRMNDIDYVNFMSNQEVQWKIKMDEMEEKDLALEAKLPEVKIPNKFFRNNGDLVFSELGITNDASSFSNGAAYADFDNDGDLDVVVNNIGDAPFLYENHSNDVSKDQSWLQLKLKGSEENKQAIGARVIAYRGDERLVKENFPVAGYQSSVEYGIHMGLGDLKRIDSIHLIWPDGTFQRLEKSICNKRSEITWAPGLPSFHFSKLHATEEKRIEITDITDRSGINFVHRENPFVEFDREPLIPHMTSAEGPALIKGDVNGDGRDDLFIGGAKHQKGALFIQQPDGNFSESIQPAFLLDSLHEDVDACFADVDGDKDMDLIVASGGNEFRNNAEPLTQRLYRNDGKGMFERDTSALNGIYMTAACVAPADYDQDGDIDLFFGGRAEPWKYGVIPTSYLLQNNGAGIFTDVTEKVQRQLMKAGMVRDAEWADLNNDKLPDLLIAVEWGPLQIYYNSSNGTLEQEILAGTNGLWNSVSVSDLDGDGDADFVAGNLGLNSEFKASTATPIRMYVGDFDENERAEQLVTFYIGDEEVLFPTYGEVTQQLPMIKKKFLFAKDFARASIADLIGSENLDKAHRYEATMLENAWFENTGERGFIRHVLPQKMQFAPIRCFIASDFDGNGTKDLLTAGNFYEANIEMGRYDADCGNILFADKTGIGNGVMQSLHLEGQARCAITVQAGPNEILVIARNNAPVKVLRLGRNKIDL